MVMKADQVGIPWGLFLMTMVCIMNYLSNFLCLKVNYMAVLGRGEIVTRCGVGAAG